LEKIRKNTEKHLTLCFRRVRIVVEGRKIYGGYSMENIVLDKNGVIGILQKSGDIVRHYQAQKDGAGVLRRIEDIIIDLNCCIKNIAHFRQIQRQTVCLLESTFNIVNQVEYKQIFQGIMSLKKSITELDRLSDSEIMGKNCQNEYASYGFESDCYVEYHFMSAVMGEVYDSFAS